MKKLFLLLISLMLWIVPVFAQDAAQAANRIEECVTDYDASVDYFPEKITVEYADGFAVEYFNHYKVVTVTNAFDNAPIFDYVLVQCGTPAPDADDFPEGTQFIEVPTGKTIVMSTTHVPQLAVLGLLDHLVGLDSFDYVGNPQVRERIDAGELIAVGFGSSVNVEAILDSEVDIVMAYGFDPTTDAHPVLMDAGIFTALNSEYRETTPLGRAEWLKFTALFYNVEAKANEVFDEIATSYNATRDLVTDIPTEERPIVLWNTFSSWAESWIIPGAQTYVGILTQDAGGVVALGEEAPENSASISFEVVYDGALDAEIWITSTVGVNTADELVAIDSRYADFAALQNGALWSYDLDINAAGGTSYWEDGVTNPHLVLQDLVAIFYPDLLPNHAFTYFRPLNGK